MEGILIQRPFFEILEDAIALLDSSYTEENKNTSKYKRVLVKASILNSILLLESCANCCLDSHPYPKKFLESIDKLSALDKYEFLLLTRNENLHIDRGITIIQIFKELINIRNQYVHPKTEKKDFKNSQIKDFKSGEHYFIQTEQVLTNILKIPKQSAYWNPGHGIKVLKAVNIFFKEFFIKWCQFTAEETTNFLTNEVRNPHGTFRMMSEGAKQMIEIAEARWGVDFTYLDYKQKK
jgi:hypothetical protein